MFQFDPPSDPAVDILRLVLPPGSGYRRLQECSIPVPSPNAPFWPDPDLRMIVVVYMETVGRAVLLIPYATFKKLLRRRPPLQFLDTLQHRVNWKDWERDTIRLSLSGPTTEQSWDEYHFHSFGSRFSLLMSNWPKFPRSSTILTFDLNPWMFKYARNPRSAVDMPHLKGCLGSSWKKTFRRSEFDRPSSIPYAIYHSFREDHEAGAGFTVISVDPFGNTEVVRTLTRQCVRHV